MHTDLSSTGGNGNSAPGPQKPGFCCFPPVFRVFFLFLWRTHPPKHSHTIHSQPAAHLRYAH